MSSGFKGGPVGRLLGVVVDEDGGTVPSAVGLVVVVSDEMPDELMMSDIQAFGFVKFGWGRFTIFGQSNLCYLVNFEFGVWNFWAICLHQFTML